jgi:DNA-binding CsgD family transcriptional regulator
MLFKFIRIILLFVFGFLYSQRIELKRVDGLLEKSKETLYTNTIQSLTYAKDAAMIAENEKNSLKMAESYLNIARCTSILMDYKDSFLYIEKGLNESQTKNYTILECQFREIEAINYNKLKFDGSELEEYQRIIKLLSGKNDIESKKIISRVNARIASYYLNKHESLYSEKFINNAISIYHEIAKNQDDNFSDNLNLYTIKGYICLSNLKYDSAYYYFNKSYAHLNKINRKYIQFISLGDYYFELKNHIKAVDFYYKSLQELEQNRIKDLEYSTSVNKKMSMSYGFLNDKAKEKIYLEKYYIESDELAGSKVTNLQSGVNMVEKEYQNRSEKFRKLNWIIFLSAIMPFMFLNILIGYQYLKLKRKKKAVISEKDLLIQEKDHLEEEKNMYYVKLQQKLDVTLEEVIYEAKKNTTSFFEKFQAFYPEFSPRLLEYDPSFNLGELTLLAYVYLNFSSKEIAEYTFRSYRTIQTRKYTLRKKLGLEKGEDLYVWLKKINP